MTRSAAHSIAPTEVGIRTKLFDRHIHHLLAKTQFLLEVPVHSGAEQNTHKNKYWLLPFYFFDRPLAHPVLHSSLAGFHGFSRSSDLPGCGLIPVELWGNRSGFFHDAVTSRLGITVKQTSINSPIMVQTLAIEPLCEHSSGTAAFKNGCHVNKKGREVGVNKLATDFHRSTGFVVGVTGVCFTAPAPFHWSVRLWR